MEGAEEAIGRNFKTADDTDGADVLDGLGEGLVSLCENGCAGCGGKGWNAMSSSRLPGAEEMVGVLV